VDDIAIQCKSEEEWEKVKSKMEASFPVWRDDVFGEPADCISGSGSGWASQAYYKKDGYTIISAAEYLNEGGRDVSEFKVGDRVKCINKHDYGNCGKIFTVSKIGKGSAIALQELGTTCCYNPDCFKLISTQTTKENNMNKNISDVFEKTKEALLVEKHLGAQIGTNFIDGLILADKKVEVLAEAKRLEKEEKEGK
jgi:hypothetical protein